MFSLECKSIINTLQCAIGFNVWLNFRKFFTDSVLSAAEEDNLHSPPPSEAYHNDLKFLTYDSDSTMKSSILALAAESSGINLDEELLSTPPRSAFDVDMDFNWSCLMVTFIWFGAKWKHLIVAFLVK